MVDDGKFGKKYLEGLYFVDAPKSMGIIMKKNKIFFFGLIILSVLVVSIFYSQYQHHLINLYEYSFKRAPYINRVFYTQRILINTEDKLYTQLIQDPEADDRRWGTANFNRPIEEQISLKTSPEGRKKYSSFMADFFRKFSKKQLGQPDKLAQQVKDFVHLFWLNQELAPEFDSTGWDQIAEKDKHPEDQIYHFVNFKCFCGTISETTVALLRELGFRTRLIRVSMQPNKEDSNHVFLEYYSDTSKKWVMLDAMLNFIPQRNGKLLSALEFFRNPKEEDKYIKTGKLYLYARQGYSIWFEKIGPKKTIYFLRVSGL